jgi:hypothetical protein
LGLLEFCKTERLKTKKAKEKQTPKTPNPKPTKRSLSLLIADGFVEESSWTQSLLRFYDAELVGTGKTTYFAPTRHTQREAEA